MTPDLETAYHSVQEVLNEKRFSELFRRLENGKQIKGTAGEDRTHKEHRAVFFYDPKDLGRVTTLEEHIRFLVGESRMVIEIEINQYDSEKVHMDKTIGRYRRITLRAYSDTLAEQRIELIKMLENLRGHLDTYHP